MGLNFFRQAVEFQKKWIFLRKKIANFIQTNGTLVNEKWALFFKENDFFVGVSLDGPPFINDTIRHFKNGKGTFKSIQKGINLLKEAEVFNGVSCCVSSINFNLGKEILDFFVANGIKSIKFLRVKGIGFDGNNIPFSITQRQYAKFLLNVFKRWIEIDDPEIEIRDIKSIVNLLLGGDFRECVYMGRCDKFATVYSDGSIYGCDSLPKSPSFYFGNVNEDPLIIRKGENILRFSSLIDDRKKNLCSSCEWKKICRGGCLQDYSPDILDLNSKNLACSDLKFFFKETEKVLKRYDLI